MRADARRAWIEWLDSGNVILQGELAGSPLAGSSVVMTRFFWMAVLVTVAAVAAPVALASDRKVMPGAACIAKYGGDQGDLDYVAGRVGVPSSVGASRVVVCPMLRDNTLNPWLDADIMLATTQSGAPTCNVICCDTAGSSCDWDTVWATPNGSDQIKDFSVPNVDDNGSCGFECTLPPGTRVRWYRWEE